MNEPAPLNDLEQLLLAAADDGEQEPAFTAALLESEVLVLGEVELDQMAVATWGDDDGDIVPFFTSEEMVHASAAQMPGIGGELFALPCRELWQLTAGTRLVLNPHGPVARLYTAVEVGALLAGIDPRSGTEVSYDDLDLEVSIPSPTPTPLIDALRGLFAGRPSVEAAHLGWVRRGEGDEGYLLFVLAGDPEGALAGIQDLDLDTLLGGHPLDVTAIPSGITDHLLQDVPPFYVRAVVRDVLPGQGGPASLY